MDGDPAMLAAARKNDPQHSDTFLGRLEATWPIDRPAVATCSITPLLCSMNQQSGRLFSASRGASSGGTLIIDDPGSTLCEHQVI